MYMPIHSELYIHDLNEVPAYLELVHNTDDDNLILYFVDDPSYCHVEEISFEKLASDENWLILKNRYGRNVEQLLCNIHTIFRSGEFLKIVRELIAKSR